MDIGCTEAADPELMRMIERRSRQGEADADEQSELWRQSVARYNVRKREEHRLAWCDYFSHLASALRTRAEEYDHRVQALLEDRGEGRT